MRLAVIAHHVAPIAPPFAGGVESLTWYLTAWLADRGHDVVMYAPPGSVVPGVEVRELDLDPGFSASALADVSMPPAAFMGAHHAYQRVMLELGRSVTAEDFDLVHSHALHYLPVAMAAVIPVPVLLTLHTPPTPWLESALRTRAAGAPQLSAVSAATAGAWADIVRIDDIVANGVDLRAWPLGPGGDAAVWCGRMVPEKAPHLAIDAARLAGLPLNLAGPIINARYWEDHVAPRLGEDIRYLGHLEHDVLAGVVGRSRVAFLTPCWEEPFGLAAAEAMSSGTPVAAFARGGLVDIVTADGGRLAAPDDVAGLAAAARRAAELPRRAVRAHARRRLGVDAMGTAYEALYDRILAGGPAVRSLEPA